MALYLELWSLGPKQVQYSHQVSPSPNQLLFVKLILLLLLSHRGGCWLLDYQTSPQIPRPTLSLGAPAILLTPFLQPVFRGERLYTLYEGNLYALHLQKLINVVFALPQVGPIAV